MENNVDFHYTLTELAPASINFKLVYFSGADPETRGGGGGVTE